jgi:hypothetical protein
MHFAGVGANRRSCGRRGGAGDRSRGAGGVWEIRMGCQDRAGGDREKRLRLPPARWVSGRWGRMVGGDGLRWAGIVGQPIRHSVLLDQRVEEADLGLRMAKAQRVAKRRTRWSKSSSARTPLPAERGRALRAHRSRLAIFLGIRRDEKRRRQAPAVGHLLQRDRGRVGRPRQAVCAARFGQWPWACPGCACSPVDNPPRDDLLDL